MNPIIPIFSGIMIAYAFFDWRAIDRSFRMAKIKLRKSIYQTKSDDDETF